jgi:hypothetical protein
LNHRANSLLHFIACEYSNSAEGAKRLITDDVLKQACVLDGYETPENLKTVIYTTYREFGFDSAKGVFEVTILQAFNSKN